MGYDEGSTWGALMADPLTLPGDVNVGGNLDVTGWINTSEEYRIGGTQVVESDGSNFIYGNTSLPSGTGILNTIVGNGAGTSLTDGLRNNLWGYLTGNNLTTGSKNCLFGVTTGTWLTTGEENVAVGNQALSSVDSDHTGTVAIGYQAGTGTAKGDYCVFLGYQAGKFAGTDDNRLYIANTDTTDPLIYGEFDNNILKFNADVTIGVGTAGKDYSLTFNGETNDGVMTWMEDEDYFKFADDVNIDTLTASKFVKTDASKTLVSADIMAGDITRTFATPTTQTVTTGTLSSGSVTDVQTWQDGNEVHISEVTGVPGFDVRYTFTNVTDFSEIMCSFYYEGSSTHDCQFQIYDDTNAVWKEFFTQAGAGLSHNTRFSPFPLDTSDFINGSDQVIIRFYHPQSGNASHDLYIDYVALIC